jgi:hypothetical protein
VALKKLFLLVELFFCLPCFTHCDKRKKTILIPSNEQQNNPPFLFHERSLEKCKEEKYNETKYWALDLLLITSQRSKVDLMAERGANQNERDKRRCPPLR